MDPSYLNSVAAHWAESMRRACEQGALGVGVVWLLCRLFPRLPAAARAVLWWLVCAKTLLGLVSAGPLALPVLPAEPPTTTTVSVPYATVSDSPTMSQESAPLAPLPAPRLSVPSVVFSLWLVGVLFLLTLVCLDQRVLQRLAAQAHPCDPALLPHDMARAIGLSRVPLVLVSAHAKSTLVTGLWRPRVVLCQEDLARLSPRELRALLAHELAHVRRRDLWIGLLPSLVRLAFFFNPLVWLAWREYDLAREAACDAEALRVSGLAPADYGRLVLKLSIASPSRTRHPSMVALGAASPHGVLLRRRLYGLQRLGRGSRVLPAWCSRLVLLATVSAMSLHPTRATSQPLPERAPQAALTTTSPLLPTQKKAKKETKPMLNLRIAQKPKLSATLAGAALAVATPAALLTPAPVVATVQEAAPAPAPPTAPVAQTTEKAQTSRAYQYTLRMGDSYSTHTREKAVASAQRALAKAQPTDCLVVDRDGKRYLITDTATLRQLKDNYAPLEELGKQMERKGKEMEDMSKPMEELGRLMEGLGKKMEEKGKKMEELAARLESASDADRQAIHEQMQVLQAEMKVPSDEMQQLSAKMREHSTKMHQPSNQMRALGQEMRVVAKAAEQRMISILDTAFKNNLAIEQKAP